MKYGVIVLSWKHSAADTVASLLRQEPAPERVVVWHNAPSRDPVEGALNIYSDENLGCAIRQALALRFDWPATVFVDDDVILNRADVCERLVCPLRSELITGFEGKRIKVNSKKPYTDGSSTRKAGYADVAKGLLCAVRTRAIPCMYQIDNLPWHIGPTPLSDKSRLQDDIWISASINIGYSVRPWIVGLPEGAVTVQTRPDGLCRTPDHLDNRDDACRELIAMGWRAHRNDGPKEQIEYTNNKPHDLKRKRGWGQYNTKNTHA